MLRSFFKVMLRGVNTDRMAMVERYKKKNKKEKLFKRLINDSFDTNE